MIRKISLFDLFGIASLVVGTGFFLFFVLILPCVWSGPYYVDATETPDSSLPPAMLAPTASPIPTEPPPTPTPADARAALRNLPSLTFINDQSYRANICAIYMATPDSAFWGANMLSDGIPLAPGESTIKTVLQSGIYDVLTEDCEHNMGFAFDVEVSADTPNEFHILSSANTLIIDNNSDDLLCSLSLIPSEDDEWREKLSGVNLLRTDKLIQPHTSRRYWVFAGEWTVSTQVCYGGIHSETLDVSGETTWRIGE